MVAKKQIGFSLLEVLVSLVVISVGLLGYAQIRVKSLQIFHHIYFLSVASIYNAAFVERIRSCTFESCAQQETTQHKTQISAQFHNWVLQGSDHFSQVCHLNHCVSLYF
jgi:type IV pilus modification protein PilV